jgi:hypothetical protein
MKSKVEQRKKGTKPPFFRKYCARTSNSKVVHNDRDIREKAKATTYSMLGLWHGLYV